MNDPHKDEEYRELKCDIYIYIYSKAHEERRDDSKNGPIRDIQRERIKSRIKTHNAAMVASKQITNIKATENREYSTYSSLPCYAYFIWFVWLVCSGGCAHG